MKWSNLSKIEKTLLIIAILVIIATGGSLLFQSIKDRKLRNSLYSDVRKKILDSNPDKITINLPIPPPGMNTDTPRFISAYKGDDRELFIAKVSETAEALGVSADNLMGCMYFETAHTLDPAETNSIGATGLIQFMPDTAVGLGTTTADLRKMSGSQQMEYVKKQLLVWKGRYKNPIDVYFAINFPLAMGKPDDWVLEYLPASGKDTITKSEYAHANPAFDTAKKGFVTVADVKNVMSNYIY